MLTLLSHSRSGRFVSGCDQVFVCWKMRTTTELSWFHAWGALETWLCCQSPQVQAQLGLMAWTAVGAAHQLRWQSRAVRAVMSLQRSHWWKMVNQEDVSQCWGVFVLANLCCVDSVLCVSDEPDDVGIVPSAPFLLLPISVTGLVLTTKYHSLIADSNRVYSCSYDLISPWLCFYWVMAKSTKN